MRADFYKNKKVLITGHTGFKGSWLTQILLNQGADIVGYSLEQKNELNLFDLCELKKEIHSIIGDIRDLEYLKKVFKEFKPEIVFHLAAQPLVRESYSNPVYTYETNVMGTVNVCECVRLNPCIKSFLNITTDKVYKNNEWEWGYRETDPLDGYDPYSNSKSCSELVTHSYISSFLSMMRVSVSTARAGNVIGGGDFSQDRIIPDCVRALMNNEDIIVRNPYSVRPYQHVLEPLYAYLLIVERQYENPGFADYYNVGPEEKDCITTGELVDLFCHKTGYKLKRIDSCEEGPHEATFLKLDCSKIKKKLGWKPLWNIENAVEKTVEWSEALINGEDVRKCMNQQIKEYFAAREKK